MSSPVADPDGAELGGASTQTTILPTARTTLSMAVYRAIPSVFARIHPRYRRHHIDDPDGAVSRCSTVAMNFASNGNVIADPGRGDRSHDRLLLRADRLAASGTTGASCATRRGSVGERHHPLLGGLMLFGALIRTVYDDWHPSFGNTRG